MSVCPPECLFFSHARTHTHIPVLTLMFMTIVMHGNKISFDAVVLYMMIKVKVIQAQIGQ